MLHRFRETVLHPPPTRQLHHKFFRFHSYQTKCLYIVAHDTCGYARSSEKRKKTLGYFVGRDGTVRLAEIVLCDWKISSLLPKIVESNNGVHHEKKSRYTGTAKCLVCLRNKALALDHIFPSFSSENGLAFSAFHCFILSLSLLMR